jgi:K+-transporting ATPase ATPase C chain
MLPPVLRQHLAALRAMLLLTVILGIAYPLVVTAAAQVFFGSQAGGSLVRHDGTVVGSELIGQNFTTAGGAPLPQWFQPRPSAGGYDPAASGASNLGPESPELIKVIEARRAAVAKFNGVPSSAVPADAVTASGSGLDPDISPAYARLQADRVARARGLPVERVRELVTSQLRGRELGILGSARVNVLELNLALTRLH